MDSFTNDYTPMKNDPNHTTFERGKPVKPSTDDSFKGKQKKVYKMYSKIDKDIFSQSRAKSKGQFL